MKTLDEFIEIYTLVPNNHHKYLSKECLPEYSDEVYMHDIDNPEDKKDILNIANSKNDEYTRIWTIIDSEGDMYIENGYHLANRLGYLITEEPGDEDESYLLSELFTENQTINKCKSAVLLVLNKLNNTDEEELTDEVSTLIDENFFELDY